MLKELEVLLVLLDELRDAAVALRCGLKADRLVFYVLIVHCLHPSLSLVNPKCCEVVEH